MAVFTSAYPAPVRTIKVSAGMERSSVPAKVASEGKAVKGLSRHKPTKPLPCNPIYSMIPLTAFPSPALGCLTEDRPKPLMMITEQRPRHDGKIFGPGEVLCGSFHRDEVGREHCSCFEKEPLSSRPGWHSP